MTDKPRDAIMGALAFSGDVHVNRTMLIRQAQLSDWNLTERRLGKALTELVCTGKIIAFEDGENCLFKKAEQQ